MLLAAFMFSSSPALAQSPPADVEAGSLALTMSGSTITAEWDHVSDATSYHVTLKAQGAPGEPVDVNTAYPAFDSGGNAVNRKAGDDTKMTLTIADAAAAAGHEWGTYWFGVRAKNAAGPSAWKAKPVSPSAPVPTPTSTPTPTPTPTPAPPPADPSQVSVSNFGESHSQATHCSARSDWYCAQGFTTGGYVLESVTARFVDSAGSPGAVVATLHATTDKDAALATLTGANPDTAGDYAFTCSGDGCALDVDTA